MVTYIEQREDLLFGVFGKENVVDDKAKTVFVFEKDKPVEAQVLKIESSEKYGKLYRLKIPTVDKIVLVTGKKALNEAMGYGTRVVKPVTEGKWIRLTYLGMVPTKHGKSAYNIKVEVEADE